jgi:hypothetical protein
MIFGLGRQVAESAGQKRLGPIELPLLTPLRLSRLGGFDPSQYCSSLSRRNSA